MDNSSFHVALALGSNLGDRLDSLRKAVKTLSSCIKVVAASNVYETAPAYIVDQPVFLNAAVIGTTHLEPLPLLWALKNIEKEIGRTPTFRFGPRVIDIDILFYDSLVL
ncbi:MAG: 2-amino-4-hydroxy-6-hydroxymethyldihydropteridine diphosphokinase, partial [Bdellovibrionales bacterium]